MAGPEDRRKEARVPLAARVQIKTEGLEKFIQKFSGDISRGGMFIKTPTPLPLGKEIHLTVVVPGGTQLIDAKGKVTWVREKPNPTTGEPAGMGIQFTFLADGSEKVLEQVLAAGTKAPAAAANAPTTKAPAAPAAPPEATKPSPAAAPRNAPPAAAAPKAAVITPPAEPAGPSLSLDDDFGTPVEFNVDIPVDVVAPPTPTPPPAKAQPAPAPRPEPPKPAPPKPAPEPPKPAAPPVAAPIVTPAPKSAPPPEMSAAGITNILGDIDELLSDAPPVSGAPVAAPPAPAPAPAPAARAPVPSPAPAAAPRPAAAPVPAPAPAPVPVASTGEIVLGIDLGTTYSCAAYVRDGQVDVVPVDSGQRTLPSVVTITSNDQVVGRAAYDRIATHPKNTIYGSKRLLGRKFISRAVQDAKRYFDYEIVGDENGNAAVRIEGEIYPLVMVTAKILEDMRHWARNHFGRDVSQAVICVPAYYNDNQRAAVIEAGRNAGFDVRRIVNEPVAAAVAYGCDKGLNQKLLVYDLGGGTFDVSVMELNANVFDVIAAGGDPYLGGVDFDNRIVDHLVSTFRAQTNVDVSKDKVAVLRLRAAAESAKRDLSEKNETRIQLPYLSRANGQPANLDLVLTRADLERITSDLIERTLTVVAEVLEAAGIEKGSIDDVLLVGGQTRMPLIQGALTKFFNKAPRKGVHPDEAVAMGAALLAASIDKVDSVVLLDVVSMSIGIGHSGGVYQPVLLRNSKLPATAATQIATLKDGQTSLSIDLFQGDFTELSRNDYLGTIELEGFPPLPAGQIRFEIVFRMDAQGFLVVHATELSSGITQQVMFRTRESPEALQAAIG